jgi:hypothetical protein
MLFVRFIFATKIKMIPWQFICRFFGRSFANDYDGNVTKFYE